MPAGCPCGYHGQPNPNLFPTPRLPPMNHDVLPSSALPRRCGNCHHAMRTGAFEGTIVACLALLEYHCADRIPECSHYRPATGGAGPEGDAA